MNDSAPDHTTGIPTSTTNGNHAPSPVTSDGGQPSLSDQVAGLKDDATSAASNLVGQAKQQFATTVSDKKDGIAHHLEEVADAVHRSGEQFSGKQDWIAGAIERGASELTTLAGSLREADLGTLVQEVQSFARRQPALFVGAALAAGFALARFGKIVAADVSSDDLPTLPEVGHGQR